MDINDVRALITLATFLAYLGVCWWAYRRRNRERFEQDAMMPFAHDAMMPFAHEARATTDAEGAPGAADE